MTADINEINELNGGTMGSGDAWDALDDARTELAGIAYMMEATLNNIVAGGIPSDPEVIEGTIKVLFNTVTHIDMKISGVMDYIENK